MSAASSSNPGAIAGTAAASQKSAGSTSGLLLGLGLATWMKFYTHDGVNLVLPDIAGTFGVSQDQASWILTTYISALLFNVPPSIWMARDVGRSDRDHQISSALAGAFALISPYREKIHETRHHRHWKCRLRHCTRGGNARQRP
jgi:hypothetical protein